VLARYSLVFHQADILVQNMPVDFPTPNLLIETPVEPSPAGITESPRVSPLQGFSKILSQRTQDMDAVVTCHSPLAIIEETPPPDVAADLLPSLVGPASEVSPQVADPATELLKSSGNGPDAVQLALEVDSAKPLGRFGDFTDVGPYSPGSGDIDSTAEPNAAGLGPTNGNTLPSFIAGPGVGPTEPTDMSAARPPQQSVLQGEPVTSGPISAKPVVDTSEDSLQSSAQPLPEATRGASPQTDTTKTKSPNVGPTADNVGMVAGVPSDTGKPLIAPAAETARQPSWLLEQPVHSRNWEDGFGDRILWLVNNRQPVAELRLNPPHLGTVEVRIAVQGDQAQVAFQVPGGAVRDAFEAALPRLREMFAEAGINLSDVGVSDHPTHQGSNADAESEADQSGADERAAESVVESGPIEVTTVRNTGQLDLFV
jgi:flagellar hook-length control protein FliK